MIKKILVLALLLTLGLTACKDREVKEPDTFVEEPDAEAENTIDDSQNETIEDEEENTEADQDVETEKEEPEEEISYAESEYEYSSKLGEENKELYVVDGEIKEPAIQTFSSVYAYEGKEYEVEFGWYVQGKNLKLDSYSVYEGDGEYIAVEAIPGRTDKVLIFYSMRYEGQKGYQICDLASNTIEPLFGGALEQYGYTDSIDLVQDLSKALVRYSKGEKIAYYDGNLQKDVLDFLPQDEITDVGIFSAGFTKNGVLIQTFKRTNDYYMSCYFYDFVSGELVKTVDDAICYNSNYSTGKGAVRQYGGSFGISYADDFTMMIWDYSTGRKTSTELKYGQVSEILLIDDKYFLILTVDAHVKVILAESGRSVGAIGPIDIKSKSTPKVISSDEDIYIEVTASDKKSKKIYKIEIEM